MLLGKLDIWMQRTETWSIHFVLYNINSEWINELNLRPEALNVVQEIVGHTLKLTDIDNDFLNRIQKAQQLKEMIEKWSKKGSTQNGRKYSPAIHLTRD
jgi:hypothetical protein